MLDYFKGWRRKFGVVTLLMACVFAGGWIRSLVVQDHFMICWGRTSHFLNSKGGRAQWDCYLDPAEGNPGTVNPTIDWSVYTPSQSATASHWNRKLNKWQRGWLGLKVCIGQVRRTSGEIHTATGIVSINPRMLDSISCELPYWFVVVPTTALSAYLLLSKPRKSTPTKTVEPTAIAGA